MPKATRVPRPIKNSEWTVWFATKSASDNWRDLCAVQRSACADTWDLLVRNPLDETPKMHPLRGALGVVTRDGHVHVQRQIELNHGARIWYYVDGRDVHLVHVHTRHPNQTK